MKLMSVLSASQYTTLGKHHENNSAAKRLRSVSSHFDNCRVRSSLELFQETLEGIETVIAQQGPDANGHTCVYLIPSKVPQSVNV